MNILEWRHKFRLVLCNSLFDEVPRLVHLKIFITDILDALKEPLRVVEDCGEA
jgi:hypothetical protein